MSTLADIVRLVKKKPKLSQSFHIYSKCKGSVKGGSDAMFTVPIPQINIKKSNVLKLGLQSHQYGLVASAGNQQPALGERATTLRREGPKKRRREGESRRPTRGA